MRGKQQVDDETFDPMEGVVGSTTKDELRNRLSRAAAVIRQQRRRRRADMQDVEDRLAAKGENTTPLMQCVFSATEDEWEETLAFLEEFEVMALLPTSLERLLIGGRQLLGKDAGNTDLLD